MHPTALPCSRTRFKQSNRQRRRPAAAPTAAAAVVKARQWDDSWTDTETSTSWDDGDDGSADTTDDSDDSWTSTDDWDGDDAQTDSNTDYQTTDSWDDSATSTVNWDDRTSTTDWDATTSTTDWSDWTSSSSAVDDGSEDSWESSTDFWGVSGDFATATTSESVAVETSSFATPTATSQTYISSTSAISSSVSAGNDTFVETADSGSHQSSKAAIIGGVVGGVGGAALGLLLAVAIYCMCKRRKNAESKRKSHASWAALPRETTFKGFPVTFESEPTSKRPDPNPTLQPTPPPSAYPLLASTTHSTPPLFSTYQSDPDVTLCISTSGSDLTKNENTTFISPPSPVQLSPRESTITDQNAFHLATPPVNFNDPRFSMASKASEYSQQSDDTRPDSEYFANRTADLNAFGGGGTARDSHISHSRPISAAFSEEVMDHRESQTPTPGLSAQSKFLDRSSDPFAFEQFEGGHSGARESLESVGTNFTATGAAFDGRDYFEDFLGKPRLPAAARDSTMTTNSSVMDYLSDFAGHPH
ncbi:hypothetical protein P7C70_g6344, partial [Phenoliferia sp. Uapishka_3]